MKKELLNLATLNVNQLPEIVGIEEKQLALAEKYPFIEITDGKTEAEAKKNRTALRTGRTSIESGDKAIGSNLKKFRTACKEENERLVAITRDKEDKQQSEIDRWETLKLEKKNEKERLERERVTAIKDTIDGLQGEFDFIIYNMVFDTIEMYRTKFHQDLKEAKAGFDFQEFDTLLDVMAEKKEKEFELRANGLIKDEELCLENERLKKENEEIAKKQAETEAQLEVERQEMEAEKQKLADEHREQLEKARKEQEVFEQERDEFEAKKALEKLQEEEKEREKLASSRIGQAEKLGLKLLEGFLYGFGFNIDTSIIHLSSDKEYKEWLIEVEQKIKDFKLANEQEKTRQKELKPLKHQLIDWVDHGVRVKERPFGLGNDDADKLFQDFIDSLNEWCDSKVEEINNL